MNKLFAFALAVLFAAPAYPAALADLPGFDGSVVEVPAAPAPELIPGARSAGPIAACPANMRGDASAPCVAKTQKTTVCSDGQKINSAKVTGKDVQAGRFGSSELGLYKDRDLRAWAAHQRRLGKSDRWADGSHQSVLASGKVSALTTNYVVLPNRAWLGRKVTVCLAATGACVEAEALEVGPKSTFKDHSEVSVSVLMALGLDAHPDSGTITAK